MRTAAPIAAISSTTPAQSISAKMPTPRVPPRPRPSSSVYLSRTSALFEPVSFDSHGNRFPSTELFFQPARYDVSDLSLRENAGQSQQAVPETLEAKTYQPKSRLYTKDNKLRESVLLLASVMGIASKKEEETTKDIVKDQSQTAGRHVTYMPALEKVYHSVLNHEIDADADVEASPEEKDFPDVDYDMIAKGYIPAPNSRWSQDKAMTMFGVDVSRLPEPKLFPHEDLSRQPLQSALSTPSLVRTSHKDSFQSDTTSDFEFDSTTFARDYHDMLAEVKNAERMPSKNEHKFSEDDVKAEMRMVPQPLFSGMKHMQPAPTTSNLSATSPSLGYHTRTSSSASDRFHEGLLGSYSSKPLPPRPTIPAKLLSPRRPFIHERKSSSSSSFSSSHLPSLSNLHVSSLVNSVKDKAKGGLATLSSLAEGLEARDEAKAAKKEEKRKEDFKKKIQVIGTCDANAAIVAARLKAVPLGLVGVGEMI